MAKLFIFTAIRSIETAVFELFFSTNSDQGSFLLLENGGNLLLE